MEKLPDDLDRAMRIIRNNDKLTVSAEDIRQLLLMGFITHKYGGGWKDTSKGREYLKWHKLIKPAPIQR